MFAELIGRGFMPDLIGHGTMWMHGKHEPKGRPLLELKTIRNSVAGIAEHCAGNKQIGMQNSKLQQDGGPTQGETMPLNVPSGEEKDPSAQSQA